MGVDPETGYYSLREILGYNAKYNFVLSDRGRGKSWLAKHFLFSQPGTFMCLYRTGPDLAHAIEDWTDPLVSTGYNPELFKWEGDAQKGIVQLWYDGEKKGFFRTIQGVNAVKQETFPDNLAWIWVDEFIPLAWKKLLGVESEGDAIRAIVKTVEHDSVVSREAKGLKPVRVLLFANPFTWDNPILGYFRVDPRHGFGVHRVGPGIVCEMLEPLPPVKHADGRMTVEEFLGDEVNRNQGWQDQRHYVEDLPKGAVPDMSVRIGGKYFTLYRKGRSLTWVRECSEHSDIRIRGFNGRSILARFGTLNGLREDEACLDRSAMAKRLQSLAYSGRLRYCDLNTKFDWLNSVAELKL